ncbi:MAG: hypothetical protein H7099_12775 [Gemmatimonadaceae bacterium]|nr:hypothetical protein [Gemmatimonadaceae bacterium]
MAIDDVLQTLLAAPKAFLESNALLIYGSNKGGSGPKEFVLQASDETGWRSCVGGATRNVPFYVMYDANGYNAKGSGPKSKPFATHYVSMREYNVTNNSWEDADTTHYLLPTDGPAVMVTSKLNGCTFGIGSNGSGARLVSHLRPQSGSSTAVRVGLDQGIRAGFAGGKLDVGIMSSGQENGTILALRTGTKWTFYAQRFQMLASMVGFINDVRVYS